MKIKIAGCIALALVLVNCGVPHSDMERMMRQEGISSYLDRGYTFLGCGEDDSFKSQFTGMKNGQAISGYVCGGLVKGYTIRYR